MNAETETPAPVPMTEFEMRVVALLEDIAARLKSIEGTADYFEGVHRSTMNSMRQMASWRP